MLAYMPIYILLIITSYISIATNRRNNNIIIVSFFILLIVMSSLRYQTGTDFHSYYSLWMASTPLYNGLDYGFEHFEIGFRILTSLIKIFSHSSIFYFFVLSSISLYLFYKSIEVYPVNKYFALFMFYTTFYLSYVYNAMGQALIMLVFLYLLQYFFKHRTKLIIIISILSTFIHISAIFILFSYILYRIFKLIPIYYTFWIGIFLSYLFYKIHLMITIFSIIFPNYSIVYTMNFIEPTTLFQFITKFMIIVILYYFYIKLKYNIFYKNMFQIYLIGYILFLSFAEFNTLAGRINMFFRVTEIMLFSNIVYNIKNLFSKNLVFIMVLTIYSYSFFKVISLPDYYYHLVEF